MISSSPWVYGIICKTNSCVCVCVQRDREKIHLARKGARFPEQKRSWRARTGQSPARWRGCSWDELTSFLDSPSVSPKPNSISLAASGLRERCRAIDNQVGGWLWATSLVAHGGFPLSSRDQICRCTTPRKVRTPLSLEEVLWNTGCHLRWQHSITGRHWTSWGSRPGFAVGSSGISFSSAKCRWCLGNGHVWGPSTVLLSTCPRSGEMRCPGSQWTVVASPWAFSGLDSDPGFSASESCALSKLGHSRTYPVWL